MIKIFKENNIVAVVGGQWGDEGKGKFIDSIAEEADIIARGTGGNNAGHTVIANGKKYVFHLLPSGILYEGKLNIIGNGTVLHLKTLIDEMEKVLRPNLSSELKISGDAHIIMPYHIDLDAIKSKQEIGTTGRGIGPAYVDKADRCGIRVNDLLNKTTLEEKLRKNWEEKKKQVESITNRFDYQEETFNELLKTALHHGEVLKPYIADTRELLRDADKEGKKILLEGAQGTLLSVDHGTYPFVTSSECSAAGLASGVGLLRNMKVLSIVKAYTTRVGNGPFPSELSDKTGEQLREKGQEYGATTGRPRRCGWLDAVALKHSLGINGKYIAISKVDVMNNMDEILVCTAYRYENVNEINYNGRTIKPWETIDFFPTDSKLLEKCKPVYGYRQPGWKDNIISDLGILYIDAIAGLTGAEVELISNGPEREKIIRY